MVFKLMLLLAIIMFLLDSVILVSSIYKKGEFYKRKYVFGVAVSSIMLQLWIGITSLPSNYYVSKIIYVAIFMCLVASVFFRKKDFNKSRILLASTAVLTFLAFFFL